MLIGIAYALSACFLWGLIFVIPQFMPDYTPIKVALGRYAFYGIISACIFSRSWLKEDLRFSRLIWLKALYFSLASTLVYYTAVVLSLRYSNPAVCALVLGISPVTISLYGNWLKKECSFRSLLPPCILIFIGLIVINLPHFDLQDSPSNYLIGLAVASWD